MRLVLLLSFVISGCGLFESAESLAEQVKKAETAGDYQEALALIAQVTERWPDSPEAAALAESEPRTRMALVEKLAGENRYMEAGTEAVKAWEQARDRVGEASDPAMVMISPQHVPSSKSLVDDNPIRAAMLGLGLLVALPSTDLGKSMYSARRVGEKGTSIDGFGEVVRSWACEYVEETHDYANCLTAAGGPLGSPDEIRSASEQCGDYVTVKETCPGGDADVAKVAEAAAKVKAAEQAAESAWIARIQPEVAAVEELIAASARRWTALQDERQGVEDKWAPGVVAGRRSAMEGLMRDSIAITRRQEAEDKKIEEACERIVGSDWPQTVKVATAEKLAEHPSEGSGVCVHRVNGG